MQVEVLGRIGTVEATVRKVQPSIDAYAGGAYASAPERFYDLRGHIAFAAAVDSCDSHEHASLCRNRSACLQDLVHDGLTIRHGHLSAAIARAERNSSARSRPVLSISGR